MRRVILDVDTGIDDALAILFCLRHPELEIVAIGAVDGNALIDQVVDNTTTLLRAVEVFDIPVGRGADAPLVRPVPFSEPIHGDDGMGDLNLDRQVVELPLETAIDLYRRVLMDAEEPLTFVALGPQTNLAILLKAYPELAHKIREIRFMGGSAGGGNATDAAEFNVWHDPEAAAVVLASGVPLVMYGLDVFNDITVPRPLTQRLATSNVVEAQLAAALLEAGWRDEDSPKRTYSGHIGDAGVLCALVAEDLFTFSTFPVRVELEGRSRGQTVLDRRVAEGAASGVRVALASSTDRVVDMFVSVLLTGEG